MTTYDSTVGARPNISTGGSDRVKQAIDRTKETAAVQTVRKRPVVSSATALAVAAVAVAGVVGGRKYAQSRRPRSRWQQLLDRVR
ncbi:hypothetical protein AB0G04_34155 [Actinoplanes sp. NPDC023801]|uniref:hypothetical protein n=1 Tax=Actinoplanes sp. NPDC023801 TaxID=3154595 RepID=UPI0033EB2A0B